VLLWLAMKVWYSILKDSSGPPCWDRRRVENRPSLANYGFGQLELATIGHPQWLMLLRVVVVPSLFTAGLYSAFSPLSVADKAGFADAAFNSAPDCGTQAGSQAARHRANVRRVVLPVHWAVRCLVIVLYAVLAVCA